MFLLLIQIFENICGISTFKHQNQDFSSEITAPVMLVGWLERAPHLCVKVCVSRFPPECQLLVCVGVCWGWMLLQMSARAPDLRALV